MLALVPYLQNRRGIPVDQVADDFGVTRKQIVNDLNVLWFCGLPGAVTGELIEIDHDALEADGVVYLENADYLDRPLRLTQHEAMSLVVGLQSLRGTGAPEQDAVIDTALQKLTDAAGVTPRDTALLDVHVEPVDERVRAAVAQALKGQRQLELVYLVPARDERTERVVDPLRLATARGRTYVEAYCHSAEAVRLFRLDRIDRATVLDTPSQPPQGLDLRKPSDPPFVAGSDDVTVRLLVAPSARWTADYYETLSTVETESGLEVEMKVGDVGWIERLVLQEAGGIRVLEPAELAARVRERAVQALAAYDNR